MAETSDNPIPQGHAKALAGPHVRLVAGIGLIVLGTALALYFLSKRVKSAGTTRTPGTGGQSFPWENLTVNEVLPATSSTNAPGTPTTPAPGAPGSPSGTSHPGSHGGSHGPTHTTRTPRAGHHPTHGSHAPTHPARPAAPTTTTHTGGGTGAGGSKRTHFASERSRGQRFGGVVGEAVTRSRQLLGISAEGN